ncbi:MAG: hypothetical protein KDD53_11655, partial [Bdellovibrionales bacterium]|nr:hypothetical protein [Bdellovibrionales bacterium]
LYQRWILKRKLQHLHTIDKIIENGSVQAAQQALKEAFILNDRRYQPSLLSSVFNYNMAALGRVVNFAEKHSGRLEGLPLVEGLFQSRQELNQSYLEALDAGARIKRRRKEHGKSLPAWGQEELRNKITSIKDQLTTNSRTLEDQIESLIEAACQRSEETEITYH